MRIKMNRIILLVALIFTVSINNAQISEDKNVSWSEEFLTKKNGRIHKSLCHDPKNFYFLNYHDKEAMVHRMALDLSDHVSIAVDIQGKGILARVEQTYISNDHLILIISQHHRLSNRTQLSIMILNSQTLEQEGKMTKIGVVEGRGRDVGKFVFSSSPDETKIAVAYANWAYSRVMDKFSIAVINFSGEILWNETLKTPFKADQFTIDRIIVDNMGSVWLTGMDYDPNSNDNENYGSGSAPYLFHELCYSGSGSLIHHVLLKQEEVNFKDLHIFLRDTSEILCIGLYSMQDQSGVRGIYTMSLDASTGEQLYYSTSEFTDEFVLSKMTDKEIETARSLAERKNGILEIPILSIMDIVFTPQDDILIISEQTRTGLYSYSLHSTHGITNDFGTGTSETQTVTSQSYNYDDIVVTKLEPKGKLQWNYKIQKYQHTTLFNGSLCSYVLSVTNDDIGLIYGDCRRNLGVTDQNEIKNLSTTRELVVAFDKLDDLGAYSQEVLFDLGKKGPYFSPKFSFKNDQLLFLMFQDSKYFKFARVAR